MEQARRRARRQRDSTLGSIARSFALRRPFALPGGWSSPILPATVLLLLVLPFDAISPIVNTSWGSLTDEKIVLGVVIVAWVLLGKGAVPSVEERRALLPTLVFLLAALASVKLADDYADDSLRFVSRLAVAAFGLLIALRLARNPAQPRMLLWAIVIGAGVSALLGIGETLRWPALDPILGLFKVAPTRVGGELRVGASFQYATIASMYFEMVVPLAIVLAATARERRLQVLAVGIAMLCSANVVLSLTRAGILTLAAIDSVLIGAAVAQSRLRCMLVPGLASAVVLVGGVGLLFARDPVFDLRLVTESDAEWYGATYVAPTSLTVTPNQSTTVELDVRNQGRITWTSSGNHPFALGYRWLTADGNGVLQTPPAEVALPSDVEPGQTIHLQANVHVPPLPGGTYRLDWGMLQRDVLDFYERGWADAETQVSVGATGPNTAMPDVVARDDTEAPWVVGRLDLWGSALQLFAAHPYLGVGPDNFRHYYGGNLGLEAWDERIRANNVYLELLADVGIIGLAAFMWVVAAPLRQALRRISGDAVRLGVVLAIGAFLIHGLLDTFLAFTPTAVLFWMLLGLAGYRYPLKPDGPLRER